MMKGIVKGLAAAGLGLALVANVAHAQKPGPEFGIQFVSFDMMNPDGDNNNSTNFGLGSGNVTVAFYLNEMIAIEPSLQYDYSSPEGGGDAASAMGLSVGVPIYLKKGWGKAGGFFIEPAVGMMRFDLGAGDAVSQNMIGVAVGTKVKISDDLHWRIQAFYTNWLENTDDGLPKVTDIGVSAGLSLYWPN